MRQSEFATSKQLHWILIFAAIGVIVFLFWKHAGSNMAGASSTGLGFFSGLGFNLWPQSGMDATPGVIPGSTPEGINTGSGLVPLMPGVTLPSLPLDLSSLIPGSTSGDCNCMAY